MNPHLDMLADVIVELAAREIEAPSQPMTSGDGAGVDDEKPTSEDGDRHVGQH